MKFQICSLLFLLTIGMTQSHGQLEITSVLNLYNQNLLLFTKDGFMISLGQEWCNDKICHSFSEHFANCSINVTEVSSLWNNSRVIGLKRVDASGTFNNPLQHVLYLILIQIEKNDLTFLIINFNTRQVFAYGNGANLFGTSWERNPCLSRMVDIITDKFDSNTLYFVCRETFSANSSLQVYKTTVHPGASFGPLVPKPFNHSNLSEPIDPAKQLENLLKEVSNLGLVLLQGNEKGTDLLQDNKITEASLPDYLGDLSNYSRQVESPIQAIDLWNSFLIVVDHKTIYIFLNDEIHQSDSIEWLVLPENISGHKTVDGISKPLSDSLLNDRTFQLAQIVIILFNFAFLLSVFYLLWVGVTRLSNCLYEGVWYLPKEPVWLSAADLKVTQH